MVQGTGKFVQCREGSNREVRNRERLCSVLGRNFTGPDILFKIEDREIFETEGCWDRESPLYNTIKDNIGALMQISKFVDLFTCT